MKIFEIFEDTGYQNDLHSTIAEHLSAMFGAGISSVSLEQLADFLNKRSFDINVDVLKDVVSELSYDVDEDDNITIKDEDQDDDLDNLTDDDFDLGDPKDLDTNGMDEFGNDEFSDDLGDDEDIDGMDDEEVTDDELNRRKVKSMAQRQLDKRM